jgi:hypothetical protein
MVSMGHEITSKVLETTSRDLEIVGFRDLEMVDFKDLGKVFSHPEMDFKHQEIVLLAQETDFLDLGIILEALGKPSKGLGIISKVKVTDSQGSHLETLAMQENQSLVVEDHMIFLLPESFSRKEAVEDFKIMDLNMGEVVGAEEEHEGKVALDSHLREMLEMS